MEKFKAETREVMKVFDQLEDIGYKMPEKDLSLRWKIFKNPSDVYAAIEDREDILSQKKKQLYEQMRNEQADFKQLLDTLDTEIV